jgi:hypothetical protein
MNIRNQTYPAIYLVKKLVGPFIDFEEEKQLTFGRRIEEDIEEMACNKLSEDASNFSP